MKKKISILAGLLLFVLAIALGSYLYNKFELNEVNKKTNNGYKTVYEWKKPKMENLQRYGLDAFDSHLPVLYIDTFEKRVLKDTRIWADIAVLNQSLDGEKRNINDVPDYQSPATINLRGASSYEVFDKEQYRIKFYRKQGETGTRDYEFLGMGSNSEWVLNGPFLDRTLLRNRVIYQASREIFEFAPDSRFCEVFVNGKYRGLYLAVEPVTIGESRVKLSDFGLMSGETAYIVKREREDTEANALKNYGKVSGKTSNDLTISYPGKGSLTEIQYKWIENDISTFEKVLYSDEFDDPIEGYLKYIDVDNFVNYFILNEVVMNNDAGNLSTYIYKEINGKYKLVVWDFNNAYNNYPWFVQDFSEFFMEDAAWFDRLLLDRNFIDLVVERYGDLRKDLLSAEHLYSLIDEGKEELGNAVDRNFKVWGYTFNEALLASGDRDPSSYADAIEQLKEAIEKRFKFLDENITVLYNRCIN